MDSIELLKKDLKHLPQIIEVYKGYLKDVDGNLNLSKKRIDVANAEHASLYNYYSGVTSEVKYLKEYVHMKLDEKHGELWQKYTENISRILQQKDKEQYIKQNAEYLEIYEKYLAICELYDQCDRVKDSFTARGYTLNNLTRLICSSMNDWEII